jgi:hypothetical protein
MPKWALETLSLAKDSNSFPGGETTTGHWGIAPPNGPRDVGIMD